MEPLFKKAEELYDKYERRMSSVALVTGFIFDSITLQRIDLLFENLIMLFYLILSGGSIALLNYYHEHPPQRIFFIRIEKLLPIFIQFTFGGLFSAFFIFYSHGANFSSSWPFILILLTLLIGNEFFRNFYRKLTFQISIYFLAVFSFFIFFIPVILKTMGATVFVLSGLVSLVFIGLFSLVIFKVVPKRYEGSRTHLRNAVVSIFIVINVLYFFNLIPPIPLALKDSGVYHHIERMEGVYLALKEKKDWYEFIPFFVTETVSLERGFPLYVFSSVFAPTDLDTNVIHDWQYYDERQGKWISATRISFSIIGGRDGGYRGYSRKQNVFEGKWRVDVKTQRDQIIGRVRFNIEERRSETEFEEQIL